METRWALISGACSQAQPAQAQPLPTVAGREAGAVSVAEAATVAPPSAEERLQALLHGRAAAPQPSATLGTEFQCVWTVWHGLRLDTRRWCTAGLSR